MEILSRYRKIALDFDGTLFDGPASEYLQEYVVDNQDKSYGIVTFRDDRASVMRDLSAMGLSPNLFATIITMPRKMAIDFEAETTMRRHAGLPLLATVSSDQMFPTEHKYVMWKGFVCMKIGASVLIDDLPWAVKPGCTRFNIDYVDVASLKIPAYT